MDSIHLLIGLTLTHLYDGITPFRLIHSFTQRITTNDSLVLLIPKTKVKGLNSMTLQIIKSDRSNELIHYLDIYLKKPSLRMKPVIRMIKKKINSKDYITERQFNSVIKFIEREPKFRGLERDQIIYYFSPIIRELNPLNDCGEVRPSTLEPFFT